LGGGKDISGLFRSLVGQRIDESQRAEQEISAFLEAVMKIKGIASGIPIAGDEEKAFGPEGPAIFFKGIQETDPDSLMLIGRSHIHMHADPIPLRQPFGREGHGFAEKMVKQRNLFYFLVVNAMHLLLIQPVIKGPADVARHFALLRHGHEGVLRLEIQEVIQKEKTYLFFSGFAFGVSLDGVRFANGSNGITVLRDIRSYVHDSSVFLILLQTRTKMGFFRKNLLVEKLFIISFDISPQSAIF
jgi:hypothetical protein